MITFLKNNAPQLLEYNLNERLVFIDDPVFSKKLTYPFITHCAISIFLSSGYVRISINQKQFLIHKPCFIRILPGQIIDDFICDDKSTCQVLLMSSPFVTSLNLLNSSREILQLRRTSVDYINEEDATTIREMHQFIKDSIRTDSLVTEEFAMHQILALFYGSVLKKKRESNETESKRYDSIVMKFYSMVEKEAAIHRDVKYYADKLNISTVHLSRITKATLNNTPSKIIEEHVVSIAQEYLSHTNMAIEEIARSMHFNSQSDFGKYFRRGTGLSPKTYRQLVNNDK